MSKGINLLIAVQLLITTAFFGNQIPISAIGDTVQITEEPVLQYTNYVNLSSSLFKNDVDSTGKILKNKFADEVIIKNTGLLRLGPDLSTSATREPTNNEKWLTRYLTDSASVRDTIPHPNYDFLSTSDLDYLLTYLLSLGEVNE